MVDRTTLLALAQRAEAGGDERLSDDVWIALGWERHEIQMAWWNECWTHPDRGIDNPDYGPRPDLRVSLDAQEALPAVVVSVKRHGPAGSWTVIAQSPDEPGAWDHGYAPTEATARLAAKLRAMAAHG